MSKRPGIKLKVASPCPASWDEMKGDDAVRHCSSCDKDVFQISNMSTEQVETFLLGRKGLRTCVRFFQRADGTLMTSDCSVGKSAKRKKRVLKVFGSAAIGASALGLGYALSPDAPQVQDKPACKTSSAPAAVPTSEVAPAPETQPEVVREVKGELPAPEYIEMLGDVAYEGPDEDANEIQGEMEIDHE